MILCPKCLKVYHPMVNFCPVCNVPLPKEGKTAGTPEKGLEAAEAKVSSTATTIHLAKQGAKPPAALAQGMPAPAACDPISAVTPPQLEPTPEPSARLTEPPRTESLANTDTAHGVETGASLLQEAAEALKSGLAAPEFPTLTQRMPLELAVNLNRVLIAGYSAVLEAKLHCLHVDPLLGVELKLTSEKALAQTVKDGASSVERGDPFLTELEMDFAEKSVGARKITCSVSFTQLGRLKTYSGNLTVTILKEPSSNSFHLDLSNIGNQVIQGDSNAGLGSDHRSDLRLSELVDFSKIGTLNDLLRADLPDNFVGVPLRLVSDEPTDTRVISSRYLKLVPKATVLTLVPSEGASHLLPLRITARTKFRLGRQRDACDLVAWFLPRGDENDKNTRALSKVHVSGVALAGGIFFHKVFEANDARLNKLHIPPEEPGLALNGVGRLGLSAVPGVTYTVDVEHHPAEGSSAPVAENSKSWPGPPDRPKAATGCVIFRPVDWPAAFRYALWIFTEATFGSGESNPLYFPDSGLASTQGRLHYYRDCFWIENNADNDAVRVNDMRLRPGELAPLGGGAMLKLGSIAFQVALEE